jgi:hypothetical protein
MRVGYAFLCDIHDKQFLIHSAVLFGFEAQHRDDQEWGPEMDGDKRDARACDLV